MNNPNEFLSDESVVRRVDALLDDAIAQRASDIHIESMSDYLKIRFRIDGVLVDKQQFSAQLSSSVIARLKILAHLNSAERRVPQDGKFQLSRDGNVIDMRVSTFPTLHGEKVVVRILDRVLQAIDLEHVGFDDHMLTVFKRLIGRQNGIFLVTGPTGSGKTTTLYAALSFLNCSEKNIVTLEDPIEYCLEGITQAQIHPIAGFTFEKGMRSLVRQDPDIIMIGEIRDKVTARIAIEASLTGHLVLSTLHTTNAPSALMRLMDMGIEPFLINASLTGVLAQRLVRMLCVECKEQRSATAQEVYLLESLGIGSDKVYQAKGCAVCNGLGYKGRVGIFELLEISAQLRGLIIQNPHYDEIYAQALDDGMKTLVQDGAQKVAQGTISLEELMRVVL